MESTSNDSCARNPKCAGTIILLLFVGFIIGFSVGFVSKDVILTTMTSSMIDAHQPPDEGISQLDAAREGAQEEAQEEPADTQPVAGEDVNPGAGESQEEPQEPVVP